MPVEKVGSTHAVVAVFVGVQVLIHGALDLSDHGLDQRVPPDTQLLLDFLQGSNLGTAQLPLGP